MTRPSPRRRRGFTMVELLVVIVIIAILIALLVPVILAAVNRAKEAAVLADINSIGQSLEAFKNQYGEYPPSRIILMENGYYQTSSAAALGSITWLNKAFPNFGAGIRGDAINQDGSTSSIDPNGPTIFSPNDLTYGQLAQRSIQYLRKFFPKAQFSTSGPLYSNLNTGWHDFNGNGGTGPDAAPILLEGHECLVFFLGGIPNHTGSVMAMDGFSKNPSNPFISSVINPNTPRNNALYEFRGDRLVDDDGDGIPGYIDSMDITSDARYLVYFSAYGQNGYDPNDVNFAQPDQSGTVVAVSRAFRVNFGVSNPFATGIPGSVSSFGPNPYTTNNAYAGGVFSPGFQRPNSYQLFAAGRDRDYGIGGQYVTTAGAQRLPFPDFNGSSVGSNSNVADSAYREKVEADNVANISSSRLD